MKRIDRVLKYLNGTKLKEMVFMVTDLEVYAYIDASYAIHQDGKSHTGAVISLGKTGGTVWTKSSKQKIVTLSSTEAELVAVHEAMQRGLWIRELLLEIGIKCGPVQLFQDNESTIHLIKNGAVQYKSKHINVRYFSIKEQIDNNIVQVSYLPTDLMKADILTKPLFGAKFIQMQQWILNEFAM
jgi:ribonuclease HI